MFYIRTGYRTRKTILCHEFLRIRTSTSKNLLGNIHSWIVDVLDIHKMSMNKGPFTLKKGPDAKKFQRKNFSAPLFWTAEFVRAPLFSPPNIGIKPTENHKDSIFRGKISMTFSGPLPLQISKILTSGQGLPYAR